MGLLSSTLEPSLEPLLFTETIECTQPVPETVLRSSRKVDECKPPGSHPMYPTKSAYV